MTTLLVRGQMDRVLNPSKIQLQAWLADINNSKSSCGFVFTDTEAGWEVITDGGSRGRVKMLHRQQGKESHWLVDPTVTDPSRKIFFRVDGFYTPLNLTVTKKMALEVLWHFGQFGEPPPDTQWWHGILG